MRKRKRESFNGWRVSVLPVHSATAWVAGGVECGAGTGAGLDPAVWALGIPFSFCGRRGGNSAWVWWILHIPLGRGCQHLGEKTQMMWLTSALHSKLSSLYDFFFISKFYIGFHIVFLLCSTQLNQYSLFCFFYYPVIINPILNNNLCMHFNSNLNWML